MAGLLIRIVWPLLLVGLMPACRSTAEDSSTGETAPELARSLAEHLQAPTVRVHTDGSVPQVAPETLLELPWGSTGLAAGRVDGDESSPMGPMSFALAPGGRIAILDQVNSRVLVVDPGTSAMDVIPTGSVTFDDLLVAPGGEIVLLDRLVQSRVVVLAASGDVLSEAPVVGPGIPRGGEVTAMLADEDGVWLERRHTTMVHVLDERLQPCERSIVTGRRTSVGDTRLVASLAGPSSVTVALEDPLGPGRQVLVGLDHRVSRLIWAQVDDQGRVHAWFHLLEYDGGQPPLVAHEDVVGVRLGPDLQLQDLLSSPYAITRYEQFREFQVAGDGTVYQMAFDEDGVKILVWRAS